MTLKITPEALAYLGFSIPETIFKKPAAWHLLKERGRGDASR
jgi:hypothetical protein